MNRHSTPSSRAPWPGAEHSAPRHGVSLAAPATPGRTAPGGALPPVSPLLLRWFLWYAEGYVRRHFHSLRLSADAPLPDADAPALVLFCNHAAWWDPLTCAVLHRKLFAPRRAFAPIEARMLDRYRMFRRLGFFGVEPGSARGAVAFLRTTAGILQTPGTALWMTPQGRFADVRERPLRLQAGLGHLAQRLPHAACVPVAVEYAFWEEQRPEILVRFGPTVTGGAATTAAGWTQRLEEALTETQAALARQVIRRDPADFQVLLRGRRGVNLFYDSWRRWRAALRGEAFHPEHSGR